MFVETLLPISLGIMLVAATHVPTEKQPEKERQYGQSRIKQKVKHLLAVSKHPIYIRTFIQFDFSLRAKLALDLPYQIQTQCSTQ